MMEWYKPTDKMPPDHKPVLVYTDDKTMKVARHSSRGWDTYQKVIAWTDLPNKPKEV